MPGSMCRSSTRVLQVTYIVGSVYVAGVVLIKERHEVQEQVEGAVHRLLPRYTVSTVPVLKKYKKPCMENMEVHYGSLFLPQN